MCLPNSQGGQGSSPGCKRLPLWSQTNQDSGSITFSCVILGK